MDTWVGVRPATRFGASAWQPVEPDGFGPWTAEFVVSGQVSEDCLYLNVWAPTDRAGGPKPVLVWIHGGAFVQGSGSIPVYDGRAIAAQGVVVVTINYRLGVLGFLAHPSLAEQGETPEDQGNFGLLDQIAALRWCKANVAAFGGNPDAITVAGQSAGAISVHMLVASARARGLFCRAIAQSGPPELLPVPTREQAEAQGLAFAAGFEQPDLQALRALPVEELTRRLPPGPRFVPMADGHLWPAWPPRASHATWGDAVPMIVGQTQDENSGLDAHYGSDEPQRLTEMLGRQFGDDAPAWLDRHLQQAGGHVAEAYREASRGRWLAALWNWARTRGLPPGAPLYAYHFDRVLPGPLAGLYGAFHTSEVPYALATLDALVDRPLTPDDHALSATINGYWLDFVRTGNPNGPGRPYWPPLRADAPLMLCFGERVEPRPMFTAATLDAWRQHVDRCGTVTVLC